MMPHKTDQEGFIAAGHAPDEILEELWEVKREINRAADYRVDRLMQTAHETAERIRAQWRLDAARAREAGSGLDGFPAAGRRD